MNKKKLSTGLAALALVGLVGIGGSLAWFTDTENATNEMELKYVNIDLIEDNWIEGNNTALPGDTLTKDPRVVLVGDSVDAWVRIRPISVEVDFDKDGTPEETIPLNTTEKLSEFGIQLNNEWTLDEDTGYFYYNIPLTTSVPSTTVLFNSITIPSNWGNQYINAKVTIDIQADAIQKQNTSETSAQQAFALTDTIESYEDFVATTVDE